MMKMENFGNSALGLVLAALVLGAAIKPDSVGEWIAEVEQARAGQDALFPEDGGDA